MFEAVGIECESEGILPEEECFYEVEDEPLRRGHLGEGEVKPERT